MNQFTLSHSLFARWLSQSYDRFGYILPGFLSLVLDGATEAKLILDCFLNLAQQAAFPLVRHFPSIIGTNNNLPLASLETPQMQHAVGLTIDNVNHWKSQILLLYVTHGPIQFVHLVTAGQDLF